MAAATKMDVKQRMAATRIALVSKPVTSTSLNVWSLIQDPDVKLTEIAVMSVKMANALETEISISTVPFVFANFLYILSCTLYNT